MAVNAFKKAHARERERGHGERGVRGAREKYKRAAERQGGCFEKAVERNVVAGGQTAKGD